GVADDRLEVVAEPAAGRVGVLEPPLGDSHEQVLEHLVGVVLVPDDGEQVPADRRRVGLHEPGRVADLPPAGGDPAQIGRRATPGVVVRHAGPLVVVTTRRGPPRSRSPSRSEPNGGYVYRTASRGIGAIGLYGKSGRNRRSVGVASQIWFAPGI